VTVVPGSPAGRDQSWGPTDGTQHLAAERPVAHLRAPQATVRCSGLLGGPAEGAGRPRYCDSAITRNAPGVASVQSSRSLWMAV
jgi:hypothetical protein